MDYTPLDIINKLMKIDDELCHYCTMLANFTDELADLEASYDKALSIELVKMESEGKAKTTAEKIAKGQDHIVALAINLKGKKEQIKNLRQRVDAWKSRLSVGQSVLSWMNQKEKYDNYTGR